MTEMVEAVPLLELRGIGKSFPGVRALDDVSFEVRAGEVHALVGENGAGKSTLLSCMNGVLQPDEGEILIDGQKVDLPGPAEAIAARLAMVHQELVLCSHLTVAQNIFLGREPRRAMGRVDRVAMNEQAREMLAQIGTDLDPEAKVGRLGLAEQQIVEICKALATDPKVIVLDEPTASLDDDQVEHLLEVVRGLRARGLGIVYVSHRLREVLSLADRMTVLRDGKVVITCSTEGLTEDSIISHMVGLAPASGGDHWTARAIGRPVMEVSGATTVGRLSDVSLCVNSGEILGVAGLLGCYREDLAQVMFGALSLHRGEIRIEGSPVRLDSPRDAIAQGISFMPADRKRQGLVLGMNVVDNVTMASLPRLRRFGMLRRRKAREMTQEMISSLSIRASSLSQRVGQLSGGNQQKIVIAKWATGEGRVVIAEDPTRGVDVGAKAEIWFALKRMAEEGRALIVMTTELEEMMQVCDRIVVMSRGRISGEFRREEFSAERITACFFAESVS